MKLTSLQCIPRWIWERRITAATVLASVLLANVVSPRLDTRVGDVLMTALVDPATSSSDVVILAIDEDTLATLPYRSPIDRGLLSDIIKHVDSAGPKAIGVDILIDQQSEAEKDAGFLNALKQAQSPVVLAYAARRNGLTEKQFTFLTRILDGVSKGDVTLGRDRFDGLVRRWPERVSGNAGAVKLFSEALAQHAGRGVARPLGRIVYALPLSSDRSVFPTYKAHHVKLLPKAWFKDKIVLIGAMLPGIDQYPTPLTTRFGVDVGTIHGVVIHAHLISQLLRRDAISTLAPPTNLLLSLIIAIAAAVITLMRQSLMLRLAGMFGLIAMAAMLVVAGFTIGHIEFPTASLMLSALLASASLAAREWYRDHAERRFIQQAFAHYVSPAVVDRIASDPKRLALGGESRKVTIIFTDLEGFTGLSEQLEAKTVTSLLNDYLDGICNLFIAHNATIDKIVGDAVIGFFGAPDAQPGQEQQAVELALAIDEFSETYRTQVLQENITLGCTRIGVHTGPAIVGNFGGRRFFDYTAIGDTVNTASRMEAANKYFGTRICVSATTAAACSGIAFRAIGDIVFKGKTEPIACFEAQPPSADAKNRSTTYLEAFERMRRGDQLATESLTALAKQDPEDALVQFHLNRLQCGEIGVKIVLDEK
ncbi:MAG: CHASE2 domain-containing protein [Hyphomicrobiaceae bacterium]